MNFLVKVVIFSQQDAIEGTQPQHQQLFLRKNKIQQQHEQQNQQQQQQQQQGTDGLLSPVGFGAPEAQQPDGTPRGMDGLLSPMGSSPHPTQRY